MGVVVTRLQGCRSMLAIPISFVSEHIETLEEMDMEYRELAMESGIQRCDLGSICQPSVHSVQGGLPSAPSVLISPDHQVS